MADALPLAVPTGAETPGPTGYDAISWSWDPEAPKLYLPVHRRQRMNIRAILQNLFLPWGMFSVLLAVMSFSIRLHRPMLAWAFAGVCLLFVGVLGWALFRKYQRGGKEGVSEPTWLIFFFVAMTIAWGAAVVLGDMIFHFSTSPYYGIGQLNSYPSVDPSKNSGQELMDAGRVVFVAGSKLDLTKTIGFKNWDLYCVAPITVGTKPLSKYDFWAVGMNCCSGVKSDYHCGEYNSLNVRGGLRLMTDDQRPFYRLAVQQAEAIYNIKSEHPLFFTWMKDPRSAADNYRNEGYRNYVMSVWIFFVTNFFAVLVASIGFSKLGYY